MKNFSFKITFFFFAGLFISLGVVSSCGVKGPPLPPVAGNPSDSERASIASEPSPTPAPLSNTVRNETDQKIPRKRTKPKPSPTVNPSDE